MQRPFVIGISGSIGSGKSIIRHFLAMKGVLPIDADELTHFLLFKGRAGHQAILDHFGEQFLASNGDLDRARLGKLVFAEPRQLHALEAILHPLVTDIVRSLLTSTVCPLVSLEAIKLYSSDLLPICDSCWFVTATKETQLQRLKETRGMSQETVLLRLRQQAFPKDMPVDYYVENSGSLSDTCEQVDMIRDEMRRENTRFVDALDVLHKQCPLHIDTFDALHRDEEAIELPDLQFFQRDELPIAERIMRSRLFSTKLPEVTSRILWRYDHFNLHVYVSPLLKEVNAFVDGIANIEEMARFWCGNSVIVHFPSTSAVADALHEKGYAPLPAIDKAEVPFLQAGQRNDGTIGTQLVKILPKGIWRFIP